MSGLILWSIQAASAWETLQRTGVLRVDPARVPKEFRRAYGWMAQQMRSRIGPPPEGVRYPLWAWYQWEGQRRRRDLRCSGYAPRGTPMVQLTVELPQAQVLLSEFDRWHTVLGGGYLAEDEADWERFSGSPGPVEPSWERIFDLDRWMPGWDTPKEEQSVQATFWELRLEQVSRAEPFLAK